MSSAVWISIAIAVALLVALAVGLLLARRRRISISAPRRPVQEGPKWRPLTARVG